MDMMATMEADYWATVRAEAEDYQRRLEIRAQEQLWRHLASPHSVPRYIPVDDDEFGTEAYTAAWRTGS
jgi:hypothetical protein